MRYSKENEPKLYEVITPIALAFALLYGGWRYLNNQAVKHNPKNLETEVVREYSQDSVKSSEDNLKCITKSNKLDYNSLYEMIVRHEGIRNKTYLDTEGILTIGVGFNLERVDARQKIESLGLGYNAVCSGKQELSNEQINILMKEDVETAISNAKNYVGERWEGLDPNAQKVIVDMAYNLGSSRLSQFKKLRGALIDRDYPRASKEMENSKWYNQTKSRAKELVKIMRAIN